MTLHMELGASGYDITVEKGALNRLSSLLNLNRKVMVVTEPGVPAPYAQTALAQCPKGFLHVSKGGEEGKNLSATEALLADMTEHGFGRGDCVLAVGGGVMGDLAGFAAACYMRGVDFYNIPTTLLSQVDSSIGGKTGVNFMGIKNLIGAFHQPGAVVIDPELLSTLPFDQLSNGMAEAVKMALCFDPALIAELEAASDPYSPEMLTKVIIASLKMKKSVVEQDEKETGLRRVLNFGHTLGHGIEGMGQKGYYVGDHGHCVALGMLPMCESDALRARVCALLTKLRLPITYQGDIDSVMDLVMHDKKKVADGIVCVILKEVGAFAFLRMSEDELRRRMKEAFD